MNPSNRQIDSPDSDKTHFYKLPCVGRFSKIAQIKLRKLLKRYCKADLDVKLVFSTFKLRNMFSVKDSVPQSLRSRVVYKFSCAGCNASYIGETTRHICARVREHLLSDKSAHVYRHLQSSRACHDSCTADCFTILDSAVSKFQLRSKRRCIISGKILLLISSSLLLITFFVSFLLSFLLLEVFVCVCVCVCVPKSLKVTMRALFLFPAYFIFKL